MEMPEIIKNEILIREYEVVSQYAKVFTSSMEIGRNVILRPELNNTGFTCLFSNKRNKHLLFNYKLELSFRDVTVAGSQPMNLLARSIEGLKLECKQTCDLGSSTPRLSSLKTGTSKVEFTFRFEFHDIQTPGEESLDYSGFTWLRDLMSLYEDNSLKDLTIKIDNEKLKAHSLILSMRSKVFRAMLKNDTKERKEGVIEIKDCTADSFKAFLKYCYTFEIDSIKNRAVDLLILADKYDVECLKKRCEEYLCGITEKSNVIPHLIAAYEGNANLLKVTVLVKFKSCVKELLLSKDASLPNNYPMLFKEVMLLLDVESQK